ncbi:MAG: hypothetical protein PHF84_02940, partial [bacterium]|nr:hypothetical protein [bacterium]
MMKQKYKIIDSVLLFIVIFLLFFASLLSYLFIKNKLNEFKIALSSQVSQYLNKKVEIKGISPIYFNGFKISDLIAYTDQEKNPDIKIRSIKIYLKIKDVLLRRISLDKSISKIYVNDYEINTSWDELELIFKRHPASRTDQTNSQSFKLIFNEGFINFLTKQNILRLKIMNKNSEVDIEDKEIKIEAGIKIDRFNDFSFPPVYFLLRAEGQLNNNIRISGDLSEINYNGTTLNKDFNFLLKSKQNLKDIILQLQDDKKTLLCEILKRDHISDIKIALKNFKLKDKLDVKGSIQAHLLDNHYNYKIKLNSSQGDDFNIEAEGYNVGVKINKIKYQIRKDEFFTASGYYYSRDNFLFDIVFNKFRIKENTINGKCKIYSDDKNILVKLSDLNFNQFKIQKYLGLLEKNDAEWSLSTYECSERFYPKLSFDPGKKVLKIYILFKNYNISHMTDLIKLDNNIKGKLNGEINFKADKRTFTVNNDLILDLENNLISTIFLKSLFQKNLFDMDYSFILNNKQTYHFTARGNDLYNINGFLENIKFKKRIKINSKKRDHVFSSTLDLDDILKINLKYKNKQDHAISIKMNHMFNDIDLNLYANLNKNRKYYDFYGNTRLKYLNNKLFINFNTENNKIKFYKVLLQLENKQISGNGYYDLLTKKIDIALNGIHIKGQIIDKKINVYAFINKLKNISFSEKLKFNCNGFLNISGPLNTLRFYADLNLYQIKYDTMLIPNLYTIIVYEDNKLIFKKLNIDMGNGKIICNINNFYKKNRTFFSDAVVRLKNIQYFNNQLNGKIYVKSTIDQEVSVRIKIIDLFFNQLSIEDITEDINFKKNTISIMKADKDGLQGEISFSSNTHLIDLIFEYEENRFKFKGRKKDNQINYVLNIDNFNINNINSFLSSIKKASGNIKGQLSFSGYDSDPLINGSLYGNNLEIRSFNLFKRIDRLNLNLKIENNIIMLNEFKGRIGNGQFSLLGKILLRNYKIDNYDLIFKTLDEKGIYFEKKENDIMGNLRASLVIRGNTEEIGLAGQITLDRFDFTWPIEGMYGSGNDSKKFDLNLDVIAGKKVVFYQDSNNLDITVKEGGKFHITGDINAKHKVIGKMEAEKGSIEYFGT